jgi:heme A synthase
MSMTRLRRLGWVTVGFTYFLVLVGGLVRITSSGEGCPDWPTCHGSLIPPLELHTDIEYSHRFTASVVSFLVIALAVAVLIWARQRRYVIPAMVAIGLLVVQIILGGITVLNDLPQNIITAHLGTALALFGTLIVAAALLGQNAPVAGSFKSARRFARLALTTTILTYLLLLSGSNVRGNSADLVCPGWPLCGRTDIPSAVMSLVVINLFHRYFVGFVSLFIIATIIYAWLRRHEAPGLFAIAIAEAIFFLIQVAVGGIMVTVGAHGLEAAYETAQGFHCSARGVRLSRSASTIRRGAVISPAYPRPGMGTRAGRWASGSGRVGGRSRCIENDLEGLHQPDEATCHRFAAWRHARLDGNCPGRFSALATGHRHLVWWGLRGWQRQRHQLLF